MVPLHFPELSDERCYLGQLEEDPVDGQRKDQRSYASSNQAHGGAGTHLRLRGIGQFSTYDFHYPEAKLAVARFEVRHAQQQATTLGPHVEKLVGELCSGSHPLRHLRRIQGILRLAKRYPITAEALDHACQRALTFNKKRLAYVKDCALYFLSHGQRPTLVTPQRKPDTVHLHQSTATCSADPEPWLPSVEEEIL